MVEQATSSPILLRKGSGLGQQSSSLVKNQEKKMATMDELQRGLMSLAKANNTAKQTVAALSGKVTQLESDLRESKNELELYKTGVCSLIVLYYAFQRFCSLKKS